MKDHVHHSAAAGYKTGADTYVRGRPDYPPAVADWLTGTLGLNAGRRYAALLHRCLATGVSSPGVRAVAGAALQPWAHRFALRM